MRFVLVAPVLALLPALLLAPALVAPTAAVPAAQAAHSASAARTTSAAVPGARVLAVSVDGLNPRAITRLGRTAAPSLWRLIDEGASTFNARSQYEQTVTLPNHTSMLTGRRINAARGGHGVTWNDDRPGTTVQKAAGAPVRSIFTTVREAGGSSAVFAGKAKFSLFRRTWRGGIDRFVIDPQMSRLVRTAGQDLASGAHDFTFLHLALPDVVGHRTGFMSAEYVDAVARTDRLLGRLLQTIDSTPALNEDLVVVLTSDHGGSGTGGHDDRTSLENARVPFVVWGPGVAHDDLYDLNPDFTDPGTRRPGYRVAQPIRNGMLADLSASLMGLPAVPGSTQDADQLLQVADR